MTDATLPDLATKGGLAALALALVLRAGWLGGLSVQSVGMVLDDGNHPVQASDIVGNSYGSGVATGRL